ncbi:MAG: Ig-like domain-containing protein [Pirellulales bacterium]
MHLVEAEGIRFIGANWTLLRLDCQPNQNGQADITVRATDNAGALVNDIFRVTVTALNDAPFVVNPIADVTVEEDAENTDIDLSGRFSDVDSATNGDMLTVSVLNSDPSLVTATLIGTLLRLDYQPNQNGQADITVRATDSGGALVNDVFRVTVTALNDAPIIVNPIADVTVEEDARDTDIDLSGRFSDVDSATNGDMLTVSVLNSDPSLDTDIDLSGRFSDVDSATNGDVLTVSVLNSDPSLVTAALIGTLLRLDYQPNQNGQADVSVRATDKAGASVDDTFRVTVNSVNDPPVATPADRTAHPRGAAFNSMGRRRAIRSSHWATCSPTSGTLSSTA